jgi:hypothetical protein
MDGIALVNLETGEVWEFHFFPQGISSEDATNWEPQDVSTGTKPIMYSSTDPQRIEIQDVYLDGSDDNTSVSGDVESLRALMREGTNNVPPALRFVCGDWQQTVVLEKLRVERGLFNIAGNTLRAKCSLSFIEQKRIERVTVKTTDPDDGTIDNF